MRRCTAASMLTRIGILGLASLTGCDDPRASGSGAPPAMSASTSELTSSRSVTSSAAPSGSVLTSAAPPTIYVPLPGATASAAIDARWPPEGFVEQKPKQVGFEVFVSNDVSVALKRHHVDNVTSCPSIASVQEREGVEVMARGGGDAEPMAGGNTPSWMVHREGQRFGVIVVHAATAQGDQGTDVACCLSGTDTDASAARATLTNAQAKKALEVCLAALSLSAHR